MVRGCGQGRRRDGRRGGLQRGVGRESEAISGRGAAAAAGFQMRGADDSRRSCGPGRRGWPASACCRDPRTTSIPRRRRGRPGSLGSRPRIRAATSSMLTARFRQVVVPCDAPAGRGGFFRVLDDRQRGQTADVSAAVGSLAVDGGHVHGVDAVRAAVFGLRSISLSGEAARTWVPSSPSYPGSRSARSRSAASRSVRLSMSLTGVPSP